MLKHICYWLEVYAFPLLGAVALVAAIMFVRLLTGRPPVESPGVLLDYLYRLLPALVVVALTGITQHQLFGYRSHTEKPLLRDDIFDACVTVFLLCFFGWALLR